MLRNETVFNVDLDGVIYPWHEVFKTYAEETLGYELPEITHWDFYEDWGLSLGGFKNLFRRGVEYAELWNQPVPPEPGAVETLWKLSDRGVYIRIVTHRLAHKFGHRLAVHQTVDWLDRWSIPYRSLVVIGNEPKTNYPCDVMIDDSPANLFQATQQGDAETIRYRKPWNEGEDYCTYVVEDWYGVEELI